MEYKTRRNKPTIKGTILFDENSTISIPFTSFNFADLLLDTTQNNDSMSSWCVWHTDHGSLTGLTRAIFSRDSVKVLCPRILLLAYTYKHGQVLFGEDEIACQIGETTAILSRGYLCATPHCVRAPQGEEARGLQRSTFALFMQPDCATQLVLKAHKEAVDSLSGSGHSTLGTVATVVAAANSTALESSKEIQAAMQVSLRNALKITANKPVDEPLDDLTIMNVRYICISLSPRL